MCLYLWFYVTDGHELELVVKSYQGNGIQIFVFSCAQVTKYENENSMSMCHLHNLFVCLFCRSADSRSKSLARADSPLPKKSKFGGIPFNFKSKLQK